MQTRSFLDWREQLRAGASVGAPFPVHDAGAAWPARDTVQPPSPRILTLDSVSVGGPGGRSCLGGSPSAGLAGQGVMTYVFPKSFSSCDRCTGTFTSVKRTVLGVLRRACPRETITKVKTTSAPSSPKPSRAPPCVTPAPRSPPTPQQPSLSSATVEGRACPGISRQRSQAPRLVDWVSFADVIVPGCACAGPSRLRASDRVPRGAVPRGRRLPPAFPTGAGGRGPRASPRGLAVQPEPEGRGGPSRGAPGPPLLPSAPSGLGPSPGTCVSSRVTGTCVPQPHRLLQEAGCV